LSTLNRVWNSPVCQQIICEELDISPKFIVSRQKPEQSCSGIFSSSKFRAFRGVRSQGFPKIPGISLANLELLILPVWQAGSLPHFLNQTSSISSQLSPIFMSTTSGTFNSRADSISSRTNSLREGESPSGDSNTSSSWICNSIIPG